MCTNGFTIVGFPFLEKLLVLFLCTLITALPSHSFAKPTTCSFKKFDTYGRVTKVYDGDTIKLANGHKIRLIGVNAPEMNYDKSTPEPYAKKAKQFLSGKVLNQKIGLIFEADKKDQYKRKLAHVFLNDGTNIQYSLLEKGYASNIAIPPNLSQQKCYHAAEQIAKKSHKGIWQSSYFKPIKTTQLNKNQTGYKRITGKIKSVERFKRHITITFIDKLTLRIHKNNTSYFDEFNFKNLINKKVTVNGWVKMKNKKFTMDLKHPSAIEVE